MAYFTESQLEAFSNSPDLTKKAAIYNFSAAPGAKVTIFLSHSHKDRKVADGLIKHLASFGISIFVDWNDTNMPRITNRETANIIKEKIAEMNLFMVLATSNALASRWVPWEIGVADKSKGERKILIIPVADASGRFQGSEYLQLYSRVEEGTKGTGVFNPKYEAGLVMEAFFKQATAI